MQIELINQSQRENLEAFKTPTLKRNWDILIIVLDGIYSIYTEGRKKPILLHKNEIAFIPSGTEFTRSAVEPVSYYHISFCSQGDHPFRMLLSPGKLGIPQEQVIPMINSMDHAFLMTDNRELITHLVERIFAENYLFGKNKKVNLPHLSEEVLSTIRYMNSHLSEDLSMDALAARVYLSHTGLIWKFKQELGTTPSQYLILLRLRYAKQLLLDHPYSITEIAELCGYANPYYFTNSFRKYSGMSPTVFRKHYLGKTSQSR
ncbi:MAG: helix-turn-helix transcriptional regulator [Clostridia bacterium]|nr:helix-turn-helix transcriptional regulator [Clostridia bacterium]